MQIIFSIFTNRIIVFREKSHFYKTNSSFDILKIKKKKKSEYIIIYLFLTIFKL